MARRSNAWLSRVIIAVLGLAFTGALLVHIQQRPGVFWTQVNVVFLAPKSSALPNNIQDTSNSVIATAGLVEQLLRTGRPIPEVSSAASLTGTGVYDGYWIRLLQSGSQWETNFDKPILEVQVAGPSAGGVTARAETLVRGIQSTLDEFQDDDGAADNVRITTLVSPARPSMHYSDGRRSRALGAGLLLGVLLTGMCISTLEAVRRFRRPADGRARANARSRDSV